MPLVRLRNGFTKNSPIAVGFMWKEMSLKTREMCSNKSSDEFAKRAPVPNALDP